MESRNTSARQFSFGGDIGRVEDEDELVSEDEDDFLDDYGSNVGVPDQLDQR